MSDKELIEAILNGNSNAFKELVTQHQQLVFKTAFAYLKDKDEAEDLAQEVFISVYENLSKFRGESNLKTWICRIAINKSINAIRKQKWKHAVTRLENIVGINNPEIEDPTTPVSILQDKQYEDAINQALSLLPESQRTAFILHKYDDLPQQEIAEIMKLSVSAVESLIHRAKLKLQQNLINILKK